MIRAIIIDDEKTSREALLGLITRYCNNVTIVDQANGYKSGLASIHKHNPDLVFLDIQMPDGSGFQLLEDVGQINFETIFTTAFDQYGIKAIKFSALDYLLKPIVPTDLVIAIQKLEQKKNSAAMSSSLKVLIENIRTKDDPQIIVLHTADNMHIVDLKDIIRCASDDYYTKFFLTDGKSLLISKTLKEYEIMFGDQQFIRPHKSHLVNIKHIKGFIKSEGGYILMADGEKVPVSRRKREMVVNIIHNFGN